MANRNISGERKALYYIGMALMILGFLIFGSIFITSFMSFGNFNNTGGQIASFGIRAILGMGMMVTGTILRTVGARGLAGSGVILDPQKARRDVEPWSRMAGGMIKDAVDESGLQIGSRPASRDQSTDFEVKLRKLYQLYQDGIISKEEFEREKAEILDQS